MTRPSAPSDLDLEGVFVAAPELEDWARAHFIAEHGPLSNADHEHLRDAYIGFLWTNVGNTRNMIGIAATCELGDPNAQGKWPKARAEQQVRAWFGVIPDFIITVNVDCWNECDDTQCCALIEHELYHAAQKQDAFGAPRFSKETGKPLYSIRGHDVEEFIGVVRRYGAVGANVRAMVDAANARPLIAPALIEMACGTCLAKVA
jgi:hypothetical protein